MTYSLTTETMRFEYSESEIDQPILWERHCHARFEMIAVAEGDINVMLEGKCYRLKKNQAAIISPLYYHAVNANEKGSYRRVTALFGMDMIPKPLRSEFESGEIRIATLPWADIERLKELCRRDDPSFYEPLSQSLMIQIFYEMLKETKSSVGIETDVFLQKSLQYIDRHLHEKILLDDLARYTSRSKSSFCHLFEEKMNISPKQYILQKKLALASKLIGEGVPPTVAAAQVGYDNYGNFYRLYCKNFGKSPTHNKE